MAHGLHASHVSNSFPAQIRDSAHERKWSLPSRMPSAQMTSSSMWNAFRPVVSARMVLRRRFGENPYCIDVVVGTEGDQHKLGDQPRREDAQAHERNTENRDDQCD